MDLRKEDFYTGAFLSYLLNKGITELTLFEGGQNISNRKIYDFLLNDKYRVYIKYREKARTSKVAGKENYNWSFPFTIAQIDEIKKIKDDVKNFYFVFICGNERLKESKLAVIPCNDVFKCIDINRKDKYKKQQVNIRLIKSHHYFDIWGTNKGMKKDGKDNTIKVKVNNFESLFGFDKKKKSSIDSIA